MNEQKILGIIFIVAGFLLSLTIIGAIYGIPLIIIGIVLIIYQKEESKIEQRKDLNKHKPKK